MKLESGEIKQKPPIFLLPGMATEYPVFSRLLPFLPHAKVVNYAVPKPKETLIEYAKRMAESFPSDCYIVGVSFGGILAQEISRFLSPKGCILISSITCRNEMPPLLRCVSFFRTT